MEWLKRIRESVPLVECLTNFVTVNDVANTILAVGASPVVCFEKSAIDELVAASSAVVLNIGTATQSEIPSFETALASAKKYSKRVVLDPVGAGATRFATKLALDLISSGVCSILRCNASELHAIAGSSAVTRGVDASPADEVTEARVHYFAELGQGVAAKHGCIVAMSGVIDVISDSRQSIFCRNGVPMMCRVTGTGCSLTGLTAAFAGAAKADELLEAAAWATAAMGCAGERAYATAGTAGLGSFHQAVLDALSTMDDASLASAAKLEVCNG